jgi:hypothetical protein
MIIELDKNDLKHKSIRNKMYYSNEIDHLEFK